MKILSFIFSIFLTLGLSAQTGDPAAPEENNNPNSLKGTPFKDRLYSGGNLGLSFGNVTTVNIAPILGYKLNKKLSIGVGAKYLFYKESYPSLGWEYQTSMYGGSAFSKYVINEYFLLHAEFETINREVWEIGSVGVQRGWVPMGLIGGGYRQGPLVILALYDVINDRNSPYRAQYLLGPDIPLVLQVGFTIGL